MSRSVCQNFHDSVSHGTGDASQLSDIVRATLEFKMHPDVLEDMYRAVEYMVYAGELNGCRVSVTLFHDRFISNFDVLTETPRRRAPMPP